MKKIILAVAVAAVAIMAVAASVASAGGPPARCYQATQPRRSPPLSRTAQIGQFDNVWKHVFNVTFDNLCASTTGSFSGTGIQYDNVAVRRATRRRSPAPSPTARSPSTCSRNDGETWALTNSTARRHDRVACALTPNPVGHMAARVQGQRDDVIASTYANHGAYVSSVGGGDDAAHSCIGMPIQTEADGH